MCEPLYTSTVTLTLKFFYIVHNLNSARKVPLRIAPGVCGSENRIFWHWIPSLTYD